MSATAAQPDVLERIRTELDRAEARRRGGLNFLLSAGPPRGITPKDVVLSRGTLNLYHYRPVVDEVYRTPVLFVMATTNKAYVFDLAPGQSFVQFLLERGYDVYVIDWNPPRRDEARLGLADYVDDFIPACVAEVQSRSGEEEVSLVGYCMGGVLALIYAALNTPGPVRNFACFTTPFDWSKFGLFNAWSDTRYFDLETVLAAHGNMPGEVINASFEMLRPATKLTSQVQLWDNIWNDEFVKSYRALDRWGAETLPLAGDYFRDIVNELMTANKLYTGELTVAGRRVDVGRVVAPFLHAVAEHDHIVPLASSRELVDRVGSTDKEMVVLKGGHVSLIAGQNAVRRLWPRLDAWLSERSA